MPADCSSRLALPSRIDATDGGPWSGTSTPARAGSCARASAGATAAPSASTVKPSLPKISSSFHAGSPISWFGARLQPGQRRSRCRRCAPPCPPVGLAGRARDVSAVDRPRRSTRPELQFDGGQRRDDGVRPPRSAASSALIRCSVARFSPSNRCDTSAPSVASNSRITVSPPNCSWNSRRCRWRSASRG